MTKTRGSSPSVSKTPKVKHDCKFRDSWLSEFKYVSESKKGDKFAFCEICNTNVSIRNGGKNDLTRHMQGKQHLLKESAVSEADEEHLLDRMHRTKRRSRVDYRKLSQGDTDWKPDSENEEEDEKPVIKTPRQKGRSLVEEKKQGSVQEKESPIKSVSIETYLLMLYVTLEQENALKEFFQVKGWPFRKPDLSSLTEKPGPTFLNDSTSNKVNKAKQSTNTSTTSQGKGNTAASSPTKHTKIIQKVKQVSNIEEQIEMSTPNSSPSKKRKRENSPEVSPNSESVTTDENVLDTVDNDCKMDGTESTSKVVDKLLKPIDELGDDYDGKSGDKVADEENKEKESVDENEEGNTGDKASSNTQKEPEHILDEGTGMIVDKHSAEGADSGGIVDKPSDIDEGMTDEGTGMMVDKPSAEEGADSEADIDEGMTDEDSMDELMKASQLRCWKCEKVLEDKEEYEDHMLKEHCFDTKNGLYYCDKCDKHFKQPDYLKDHNIHIHEGKKRKPQKVTRDHVCEICGRGFKRPDQLKEHRSMVHFKKPLTTHACEICGKKFSRPRLLGYHMNKHLGTKPFQCSTCGNSYFSRGGLYVHSRACQRVNVMIYECDICNKRFSNQYALKVHINGIHNKSQLCYRCDCGKLLKYKTSIKRHRTRCPINAEALTEITREEYDQCMAALNPGIAVPGITVKAEFEIENPNLEGAQMKDETAVTEVTDERFVQEITVKIADELNKSGKVNTEDEKLITDTIRNAVLSVDETQVITIPRPSGTDEDDHVYYVIVNPPADEQF